MTVEVDDDKQVNAAFDKGFGLETPAPETAKVVPKTETKVEQKPVPKVEPKVAAKAPLKTEPVVPAPKYRRITEDEWNGLQASTSKLADMEKQVSKLFGTTGDMQQIVKKLQTATPTGMTVELPDDVVSEMEAEFPELAGHFRKGLEKALKGIRGTGPVAESGTAAPDQDAIKKLFLDARVQAEDEALEDAHPKWREIVGTDSTGKSIPGNAFRAWLAKQPADYQQRVNSTNSATVISRAIDKFQAAARAASTPKPAIPAPKVAARKDRIQSAVTPRGDGNPPAPNKTTGDAFEEGFRTG